MEDNFRRRTNLHDSSRRRRPEGKKGGGLSLTGVQIIVCLLCILAASVVRLAGGSVYSRTRSFLSSSLTATDTGKQLSQVFASFKGYFPDVKDVFASSATGSPASGGSPSSAAAGASSGASSAVSASSSAASSSSGGSSSSQASSKNPSQAVSKTSSQSSSASSKTSGTLDTGAVKNTSLAAGIGEPVPAVLQDGGMAPPKNASLGPYLLTVMPIWPVSGRISSGFGYRSDPITGELAFHSGLDIAAAEGTPVKAALPGTVETSAHSDSYGNYLVLRHGQGVATLYANCQTLLAKAGDVVKQGDVIAKVGTTGESTGYHLHFEIRLGSECVNPAWVLPGAADGSAEA